MKINIDRKNFINYIIGRGIYDYHIGTMLNVDIVNSLLFNKKSREDVKYDILTGIATTNCSTLLNLI